VNTYTSMQSTVCMHILRSPLHNKGIQQQWKWCLLLLSQKFDKVTHKISNSGVGQRKPTNGSIVMNGSIFWSDPQTKQWQSRVENLHYSGMQLLRKTRLKNINIYQSLATIVQQL